jgi:lipopolysaccharide export system protein LptA
MGKPSRYSQCPGSVTPLPDLKVSTYGRIWVSTEAARWSIMILVGFVKHLVIPIVVLVTLGGAQVPVLLDAGKLELKGTNVVHDGRLWRATGAEIKVEQFITFKADKLIFDTQTSGVDLQGHARFQLPGRAEKSVFRYGSETLVTDQPAEVSADHFSLNKEMVLNGAGHVLVRAGDVQIQADTIEMDLKTSDAHLSGDVQPPLFRHWPKDFSRMFPPEIELPL